MHDDCPLPTLISKKDVDGWKAMVVEHKAIIKRLVVILGDGNGTTGVLWEIRDDLRDMKQASKTRTETEAKFINNQKDADGRKEVHISTKTAVATLIVVALIGLGTIWAMLYVGLHNHSINMPNFQSETEKFNATLQTTGPIIYDAITGRR